MKLFYNQFNFETCQEEEKQITVNDKAFSEWLSQSDFEDLTDFEDNYNSEDITELLNYLDFKTLSNDKEYYNFKG